MPLRSANSSSFKPHHQAPAYPFTNTLSGIPHFVSDTHTQARAFLTWADAGQRGWTETHIESIINIAGTSLGVPKSITSLLSGETRDTAQLGALAGERGSL